MNDYFNLNRFFKLCRNDIKLNSTAIFIVLLVFIIFFLKVNYLFTLYIGGLILASYAFNHIHDRQQANLFLMLPCSNLERFLNRWFVSAIGYPFVIFMLYKKYTEFSEPYFWYLFGDYLIYQSIVLLGAITFKKYVVIKTAVTVLGISLVFGLLYLFMGLLTSFIFYSNFSNPVFQDPFIHIPEYLRLLIIPFCWYVAYLRLTEYELN